MWRYTNHYFLHFYIPHMYSKLLNQLQKQSQECLFLSVQQETRVGNLERQKQYHQ